jgi:glutamine cyclotransferase
MTDGSNKLTFISPETLEKVKEVFIYNDEQEFVQVNELEYVSGSIYGNVYGSMLIVRIDPKTGKVLDYIDCTGLVKQNEITQDMDVMNGIAFRESSGTFFLTGKNWPKMYEVRFVPK